MGKLKGKTYDQVKKNNSSLMMIKRDKSSDKKKESSLTKFKSIQLNSNKHLPLSNEINKNNKIKNK
jgi:hypothetical protein